MALAHLTVNKETKRPLGHVGALQVEESVPPEITWTLWSEAYENKGYAIEASRSYYKHARNTLQFRFMVAQIMDANTQSIRLAEKLGGKLNATCEPPSGFPNSSTYDFDMNKLL